MVKFGSKCRSSRGFFGGRSPFFLRFIKWACEFLVSFSAVFCRCIKDGFVVLFLGQQHFRVVASHSRCSRFFEGVLLRRCMLGGLGNAFYPVVFSPRGGVGSVTFSDSWL